MPTYVYRCPKCRQEVEHFCRIDDRPDALPCPLCGVMAGRIVSFQGGLETETASWIDDNLRGALQGDGERPIETRSQYKTYLKEKGIVERG